MVDRPHNWLWRTTPATKLSQPQVKFWLGLSLAFTCVCGGLALKYASGDYVVDSDARQHVFWMQRFANPGLFPQDWITDYHQSVAPIGYTTFYWLAHLVGIAPFTFNKLLPLGLSIVTTLYGFWLCLEFLPLPVAGFLSTLLLNQTLWMRYDLVSGTARSFVYPLFLAFLYYLLRRKLFPCLVALALQGLFYPQILFVSVGILLLQPLRWRGKWVVWVQERSIYQFCLLGLGVALLVMLPYALQSSQFGPAITAAEAKTIPEFLPGGRARFFHENFWEYWLYGKRSGIMPQLEMSPLIVLGLALPILLALPRRFPFVAFVRRVGILGQTVLASLGMFLLAHMLLFKLHLPSRYTMHTLPIVLALAAGIGLVIWVEALLRWVHNRQQRSRWLILSAIALLTTTLLVYPLCTGFPYAKYKQGKAVALYQFLVQQPEDTLVASLSAEADNLPSFAQRSVLVSDMYAIPYHVGYYREIRQRSQDLLQAQYTPNSEIVAAFIRQYGIDFWLLDHNAFTPNYLAVNNWLMQYDNARQAIVNLQQGTRPAIVNLIPRCTVVEVQGMKLLDANCILERMKAREQR